MNDHTDKLWLLTWFRKMLERELDEAQMFDAERDKLTRYVGLVAEIKDSVLRDRLLPGS